MPSSCLRIAEIVLRQCHYMFGQGLVTAQYAGQKEIPPKTIVWLASGTEIGQNMLEQILRFSFQWRAKRKLRTCGGPKFWGLALKIFENCLVRSSNFYGVNTFRIEVEHQSVHHFWDFYAPVRAPGLMLGQGSLKQHQTFPTYNGFPYGD